MICALDDDPFVLEVITEALEPFAPVRTTTDWSGVNKTLTRHGNPDTAVLICDVSMPGIDGVRFCEIVRRFFPTAAIVVFTADEAGAQRACGDPWVDEVVLKTNGVRALERSVRRLLATERRELGI